MRVYTRAVQPGASYKRTVQEPATGDARPAGCPSPSVCTVPVLCCMKPAAAETDVDDEEKQNHDRKGNER